METCQHLQMLPKASWKLARWEALGRQLEVVPVPAGQTAAQAAAQTAGSGGWHLSEEVKRWEQDINESYHKLETLKEAWSKNHRKATFYTVAMLGCLIGPMGGFALGYLPFLGAAAVVMASIAAKDIKEDPGLSLWQAKHAYASATSHLRKAISDHQSTLKQSASSDISYEICFCEDGSNMNARSRQQQQPNNLAERGSPLPEDTEGQMAADSKEAFAKADRQPAQHSAALKEADARAEAHATALVHADSSPSLKVPENSASDRAELQAVLEDKAELQAAVKDRAELQIVLKAVDDRAEQAEALDQQQQILIARLEDAEQLLKLLRGRAVEEHTALLEQQSRLEDAEKSFQVRMQEVERTAAARAEQAEAAVMKLRRQLEEVQQQLISQSQEAEEATRDRAEAQSLRRVLNAERQKFAKLRQLLKDRPAVPAQVSAETALPCPADSPNHHESTALPESMHRWFRGHLAPGDESSAAATFEADSQKPGKSAE